MLAEKNKVGQNDKNVGKIMSNYFINKNSKIIQNSNSNDNMELILQFNDHVSILKQNKVTLKNPR